MLTSRVRRSYVSSNKVKKEYVEFIKKEISKNKTITMNDLLIKLKEKYNEADISLMQVHRIVKDINITLKQTKVRHVPVLRYGKPIEIEKQIKDFYKEVSRYNLDDLISIDETSLNTLEIRKHCYETIGKRCTIKTTSQEVFKKYTGIFAITTKGVIGYEIYDKGGIDSNRLIDFINKFITGKYKNKLIVLDNASSHRNKNVKDLINKDNKLLYSVPYQHFTNVIENFFSVLKSKLRKEKDVGLVKLKNNIRKIINSIPEETYKNLFKGSYNKSEKYIPKKSRKKTLKNYK